jgi:VWFA-related protein
VTAAVLGLAAAVAQEPAAPPQFRAGVDIVIVEATVVDEKDALVPGLGAADFAVEIGGKAREVVSTELARYENAGPDTRRLEPDISTNVLSATSRTVLIVVDQLSLRPESRYVLNTAQRWVATLGPSDRVGLVTLPLPGINVEFTTEHARVIDTLDKIAPIATPPFQIGNFNVSIWEAFRIDAGDTFVTGQVLARECKGEPLCPQLVDMQAKGMVMDSKAHTQPVLGSLRALMKGMGVLPGPKHVVLLSAGWAISEREIGTDIESIAADAAVSNVTVHTFTTEQWALAASRSRPNLRMLEDRSLLTTSVESLSGMTGGRAVRLVGQGDAVFASLSAGLSGYYRLGVRALPEDLDGKPRRISVKVLRDGARIAGHRRVLAGTASAPVSPDPTAALRGALESTTPLTALELRATTYLLHGVDGASRALRVVVVGDVSGAAAGPARVVAALYTLDGKAVTAMENAITIAPAGPSALSVAMRAPPDAYVLRLAVRDVDGHLGSLERAVDARWKQAGTVETPGLVLLRSGVAAGSTPKPVFRTVTTAEQIIAQVPLAGAADPKPQVTFDVRAEGSPSSVFQQIGRLGSTSTGLTVAEAVVPVSTLPPGRYTISATIRSGKGATFARTFLVEPESAPPGE